MSKHTKICSNHFEYGRSVKSSPIPTLFLKGYDDDAKVDLKMEGPTSRKEPPTRKKTLRNQPALQTKKSQSGRTNLFNVC